MEIKLAALVEAISLMDDETTGFYNRVTGEFNYINDYVDDVDAGMIDFDDDRYLRLPTAYEIDDYQIMQAYTERLPAGKDQRQLAESLRGRGAFHHFRETLIRLDLEQAWYAFQDQAYRQIAIDWCHENGLTYK
ncbi:hypothetical protein D1831_13505 [Lactiplantibacillus garii]|uniref:Uncharacterized protein n=1 Tax=Lactiplantibacillus garii TaxID=2306423 RepID=A0A426D3X9_9LACO|nr:UPF0158 family protein [Lactiplantibacillus garii]RRK09296.1 hypothetical protein D1831_13505 [Lactiplantibacillus garii]